jgi:Protein of unknown function (DUF1493)
MGDVGALAVDLLEQRLLGWIVEQLGSAIHPVTLDSEIERDMGVTGEDAWDLMEKFGRDFEIDMAKFRFERHFGPEGMTGEDAVWLVASVSVFVLVIFLTQRNFGLLSALTHLVIGILVMIPWSYLRRYLPQERHRRAGLLSVKVHHLVEAAWAKKWPFEYRD